MNKDTDVVTRSQVLNSTAADQNQKSNLIAPGTDARLENTKQTGSRTVRSFVAGHWVVVDCEKRMVLQCPHQLMDKNTSPSFAASDAILLQGACRDVSIDVNSFCAL